MKIEYKYLWLLMVVKLTLKKIIERCKTKNCKNQNITHLYANQLWVIVSIF